jgi:hypothetical protein
MTEISTASPRGTRSKYTVFDFVVKAGGVYVAATVKVSPEPLSA